MTSIRSGSIWFLNFREWFLSVECEGPIRILIRIIQALGFEYKRISVYVFKGDLVHFWLEDLKCIIESLEPWISLALCWPLGFKINKMWSVLTGKKGGWELTPKCLPCIRSFEHTTSDLCQTFWQWGKIILSVTCSARIFQHIGKVADLM